MYRNRNQREFARTLRNYLTDAEKRLWKILRAQQLRGYKFRRQVAIGPYVVDVICFACKLIIELDGAQHAEHTAAEYDAKRTAWLTSQGFSVLRFRNHQLDDDIQAVVESIAHQLESPLPNPLHQKRGNRTEKP